MATITINIPTDKETYVLEGIALARGYQSKIPNPNYNDTILQDPIDNPAEIDNTETLPIFSKRMIIIGIKQMVAEGHSMVSEQAELVTSDNINYS